MLRLPLKHLHRAFPELDGYSDEQCRRFVRAARGSTRRERFIRALAHFVIISIINILCFAGAATLLFWIIGSYAARIPAFGTGPQLNVGEAVATLIVLIALVSVGPILGYLARDFLVIDRIRWILRSRGMCATCHYSLVGLAVSTDHRVTCPECATSADVDPSLGELTTDEAGRPRFRPDAAEHVKAPLIARTPDWIKGSLRAARVTCIVLVILIALTLLSAEAFLHIQAAKARSNRPTRETFQMHMEAAQPPGTSHDDPDAFEVVEHLVKRIREVQSSVIVAHGGSPQSQRSISYWYVGLDDARLAQFAPDLDEARAERQLAIECLHALDSASAFELFAEFVACERALGTVHDPETEFELIVPYSMTNHVLRSVAEGRARLAISDRNGRLLTQSVEVLLAISRFSAMQGGVVSRYWASSAEQVAHQIVVEASLVGMLEDSAASMLIAAYDRQAYRPPLSWNAEWDRFYSLAEIALLFESASDLRLGPWSSKGKALKDRYGGGTPAPERIGTYTANVRAIDAQRDYMRTVFEVDDATAMTMALAPPAPTGLIIPDYHSFPIDRILWLNAQNTLNLRGVQLLLRIERFRELRGVYPETLDQLIPEVVSELPRDLWGDAPLAYRRVDPATDQFGRSFLLYSVGADETDNNGRPPPFAQRQRILWKPVPADLDGFDYIINEPNPKRM